MADVTKDGNPSVAIIGAGIGGASAAYFLRQLVPDAHIDVYDRSDVVGGRMAVCELAGSSYEIGGTIMVDKNEYLAQFVKETDSEKNTGVSGSMGIYNGEEFLMNEQASSQWATRIKFLWRQGLMNMKRVRDLVKSVIMPFGSIYKLQDQGQAFTTCESMLQAMGKGDHLLNCSKKSLKEIFEEKQISESVLNEVAVSTLRYTKGQSSQVNGLTGTLTLAGILGGDLFSIKGGNYTLCEKLFSLTETNLLLQHQVLSVGKVEDNNKYKVAYKNSAAQEGSREYDAVIVAVPIESEYIKGENCSDWPSPGSTSGYKKRIVTLVASPLNYESFGLSTYNKVPFQILTTEDSDLPYEFVGEVIKVDGTSRENLVYKVFSPEPLSESQLSALFADSEAKTTKTREWYASPVYQAPEQFTPFVFDAGVFYVNAIERISGGIEMSAIGGRNAALLAEQYLSGDKK